MSTNENIIEAIQNLIDVESGHELRKVMNIGIGDTQNRDAFGRLRVSEPIDLFDNKNTSSRNEVLFDEVTSGGGSIDWDYHRASVQLNTSGADGDRALRQTPYNTYIPGKSQLIELTSFLAEGVSEVYVVKRSSVGDSVVETRVAQESWNRDTLLGTGDNNASGAKADFTKGNIFQIDMQWLGLGRVRMSLVIRGVPIDVHHFDHANTVDEVYMRTPTLPMRYEIVNSGGITYSRIGYFDDRDGIFFESQSTTEVENQLREICCSCASESGTKPTGLEFHANTRLTNGATATVAGVPVLAVRLKAAFNGHENRSNALLFAMQFFAEDENVIFELFKLYSPDDTGTTWTSVSDESVCEYAVNGDIGTLIGYPEHMISCATVPASGSGSKTTPGTVGLSLDVLDEQRKINQNFDSTNSQVFLLRAYTMAGTTRAGASMTWLEVN